MYDHPLFGISLWQWRTLLVRAAPGVARSWAEDIAQDVIAYFLAKWQRGPTTQFRNFLDAVAHDVEVGRLHPACRWSINRVAKKYRPHTAQAPLFHLDHLPDPWNPTDLHDLEVEWQALSERLPGQQRSVARRLAEGRTIEQTAEELAISQRTIRCWRQGWRSLAVKANLLRAPLKNQ